MGKKGFPGASVDVPGDSVDAPHATVEAPRATVDVPHATVDAPLAPALEPTLSKWKVTWQSGSTPSHQSLHYDASHNG